jgi:hypothetical protein
MARGSAAALEEIHAKCARTKSIPVVLSKDGKSTTHASATIAAKELGLDRGSLVKVLKKQLNSTGGFTAVYAKTEDLPKEIWEKLPKLADVPEYIWERRQDTIQRPRDAWEKTLVSNMGRVKIGGIRVTCGTETEKYLSVQIDGMSFFVHVLCALTFKLDKFKRDYQVDHLDEDKHNNKIENLIPRDPADHSRKTHADNPEMGKKSGMTRSKMLKLVESPRKDLIGQIKTTIEWAKELKLSSGKINCAARQKGKADKKHKFEVVVGELLKNEKAVSHIIYIGNKVVTYTVSTFGRFYWRQKWQARDGQVKLAGQMFYIHQLVLLAKTRLQRLPVDLTVDHINGRDMEFPHKMSNLRWATHSTQTQNRGVKRARDDSQLP